MSKHTPGPWSASIHEEMKISISPRKSVMAGVFHISGGPDGGLIASFSTSLFPRKLTEEEMSNAKLLAAAPELLAALQAIVEVDHPDADYTRMVERAKRIARNAIEKATGEKA